MTVLITYYAPNDTMGDTSEFNCQRYREWASEEIRGWAPEALNVDPDKVNVSVINEQSTDQVKMEWNDDEDRSEQLEEVQDFVNRLWDRCPWDWI